MRTQYAATNANWTKVRVTGYRNRVRMDLPVLEEKAEERYHRQQRKTKPAVEAEGRSATIEVEGGEDPSREDSFGRSEASGVPLLPFIFEKGAFPLVAAPPPNVCCAERASDEMRPDRVPLSVPCGYAGDRGRYEPFEP